MEIISRRELFKRVGRFLPAFVLAAFPILGVAESFATNCKNSCSVSCQYTCKQHCRGACYEDPCGGVCAGRCNGTCRGNCNQTCTGMCMATCYGSCANSNGITVTDTITNRKDSI